VLSAQEINSNSFRTLVNLSNYIANDYKNAVQNKQVINEFEYEEMQEFSMQLYELHASLLPSINNNEFKELEKTLDSLQQAIEVKADPLIIQNYTQSISKVLMELNVLATFPSYYPNIANGKLLYQENCSSCHGVKGMGDGSIALGLNPPPANLKTASHIFPFHIYNTVVLGIEGTSMVAQNNLSESETWDLAFYVMTLQYPDSIYQDDLYSSAIEIVGLEDLSNKTNAQLASYLGDNGAEKLKALRFHQIESNKEKSLQLTLAYLNEALAFYKLKDFTAAKQKALDAYFIGFEPLERELGATNPSKVAEVEHEMLVFRNLLEKEGNEKALNVQYDVLKQIFDGIQNEKRGSGFWFAFLASISILLREGLEALLIVLAILSALQSLPEGKKAKWYLHFGWISALILGIVSYFFVGKLIAMGAHKRELLEGFGALLAVVILLSVGFWMHSKSNAIAWSQYVKSTLSKHLQSNSFWSIALLSFVVVFREAFESVIFLSTLTMNQSAESSWAVILGFIFSACIILVIAILILYFSKKLPVHQVFKISSITMLVLAVILAGKGVKELQEASWIAVDLLPISFSIDILGLYATYQTLAAQLMTLVISISLAYYNNQRLKA
jgi:high-affinity iron transporter